MKNKKKMKRILMWILVILLMIPTLISLILLVKGESLSEIKTDLEKAQQAQEQVSQRIKDINNEKDLLSQQLEEQKAALETLREKHASVFAQKTAIDQQLNTVNDRIDLLTTSLEELEMEIETNSAEIELTTEKYNTLYELFKSRVRVYSEEGKISYLSVILSSGDISEFLNRIRIVSDILQNDSDRLTELNNLHDTLVLRKDLIDKEKEEYDTLLVQLNSDLNELQILFDDSIAALRELEDEENASSELLDEYESLWAAAIEEQNQLAKQYAEQSENIIVLESQLSSAIQSSSVSRSISESVSVSVSHSRSVAQSIAKSQSIASSISRSRYIASSQSVSMSIAKSIAESRSRASAQTTRTPVYGDGTYIWPTPGYYNVTSKFGGRYHPITGKWQSHSGIDIGAPYGTKVLAIADGIVIESGYNDTFGNHIRIDHGNGNISLYGHFNKKSQFKVGNYVTQGTIIGYVGSTGLSTAAHLHITIYQNGVLTDPLKVLSY